MTDAEMRDLMAEAGLELASLKKTRACIRTKRDLYRKQLKLALRILEGKDGTLPNNGWPSADDIRTVRASLADAGERIDELESRFRAWGGALSTPKRHPCYGLPSTRRHTMGKTDPKYEKDLRFAPADESLSDEELRARADRLARAAICGGAPRREDSEPKKPETV